MVADQSAITDITATTGPTVSSSVSESAFDKIRIELTPKLITLMERYVTRNEN